MYSWGMILYQMLSGHPPFVGFDGLSACRAAAKGDRPTPPGGVAPKLKELLHEGNVRHIVIKNDDGKVLIEFPVTIGLAGALLLPVWAAVGAIAAMVTNCTIEVERTDENGDESDEGDDAASAPVVVEAEVEVDESEET